MYKNRLKLLKKCPILVFFDVYYKKTIYIKSINKMYSM